MARRTGRTTRMLHEALDAAIHGQSVIVIAANARLARDMQHQLHTMAEGYLTRVSLGCIEFPGARILIQTPGKDFDWMTLRVRGMDRSMRVLVDHYAIEMSFEPIITMLHRFDS